MTTRAIWLVLRHFDYESTTVLSAWTSRDLALKEAARFDDPERPSYESILVQEVALGGQKCGMNNCGGTEIDLCCDRCRCA